jgi:hypothetical protein
VNQKPDFYLISTAKSFNDKKIGGLKMYAIVFFWCYLCISSILSNGIRGDCSARVCDWRGSASSFTA